jgi:hypothetical protein
MEHSTVRECRSIKMSIGVNVFLELVGLVTFTDRVRCQDGNLSVSMSYLSFFMPILAKWHIVSSCTGALGLCVQ